MGKRIEMSDIRIVMSCTFCSVCTSISWVMDEVYIGAAHLTYGIINRLWEIAAAAAPTPTEGEASSSSSLLVVVAPELSASWINFVANLLADHEMPTGRSSESFIIIARQRNVVVHRCFWWE